MFGLAFERVTLEQATRQVLALVGKGGAELIVTPNVDHVVTMQRDPLMMRIFQAARYRYADGMPIVALSRMRFNPGLPERVTGADLLISVAEDAARSGASIFLMGGRQGVALQAAEVLRARFPGLVVSGTDCPAFGFEADEKISRALVNKINKAGTNILFVGVGAPKQEKWAALWRGELQCDAILGVGAALDFAAGTLSRAPLIVQRSGFEWLWRMAGDPKRLGPRYFKDSRFVLLALCEILKGFRQSATSRD